jgi:hypothetical protein
MGLNFQGVARNSSNAVIANQAVSLRLSILQGSSTGSVEYSEIRKVNTNAQGLFNAVIGESGGTDVTGNFSIINWKNIPKFLKIELDVSGGTNFVLMGTTQFQYVAYAQFANAVDAANIMGIVPAEKGGTGFASINELKTALAIDKSLALKANISRLDSGLAEKVDKISGKVLSTNDYTMAEKTKLAGITGTNTGDQDLSGLATAAALALKADKAKVDSSLALKATISIMDSSLATKVVKVTGKGLSANDYTTAEKTKLAGITGTNTGDQDLSGLATTVAVALKADKAKVDSILALKATISKLDSSLATKVEKLSGKGLSTNDYTTAEKTKLAGITGTNTGDQTDISGNAATATLAGNISATNNNTLTSLPNLTSLGTITSGTWSGTAINAGNLSGTTLATNVLLSSLTKVGVLTNTTINGKLTVGGELGSSPSSILEVNSTNRGFLPPRMGYLQRNAIVNPEQGLVIYCKDCGAYGELQIFNGINWTNSLGTSRALGSNEKYVPFFGDYFEGGIVAYILSPSDPGYEANYYKGFIIALNDVDYGTRVPFNIPPYFITSTGNSIGSGLTNTNELIARLGNTTNHAAGLARSYKGGGFTDWYLPSKAELSGIQLNFDQTNNSVIGDMSYAISPDSEYGYWTSTYDSSNNYTPANSVLWSILHGQLYLDFGNELYFVRPIRNFKVAK